MVEQDLMMVELLAEQDIKPGLLAVTTDGPPSPIFSKFFLKKKAVIQPVKPCPVL